MAGLSKEVIILIVILAAGASVLMAWAMYAGFQYRRGEEDVKSNEAEQAAYRREVRQRNHEDMAAINGFKMPQYRYDEV